MTATSTHSWPERPAVHQATHTVDRVRHRQRLVQRVQRRRQGLPREGATGADQLQHHQHERDELAHHPEPGHQGVDDRDERGGDPHHEQHQQRRVGDVDAHAARHHPEGDDGLRRAEQGGAEPATERDAPPGLARRERAARQRPHPGEQHEPTDPQGQAHEERCQAGAVARGLRLGIAVDRDRAADGLCHRLALCRRRVGDAGRTLREPVGELRRATGEGAEAVVEVVRTRRELRRAVEGGALAGGELVGPRREGGAAGRGLGDAAGELGRRRGELLGAVGDPVGPGGEPVEVRRRSTAPWRWRRSAARRARRPARARCRPGPG